MTDYKFERIEKKFWMSAGQFRKLEKVLSEHMEADKFGRSLIKNLYCDTDDYVLIRKSIERPLFKEKLRIRSYNGFEADSKVFVEIKRKVKGVGYKRRIEITFAQAKLLLQGCEIGSDNAQIERELREFIRRYHPEPRVYLTYERTAMTEKGNPQLRITIDRDIRYRIYHNESDLEKETAPVMDDESMVLMEVKAPGCIPKWLTDEMSRIRIYQAPFSKIGTCFTKFIAPDLRFAESCERETPDKKEEAEPFEPKIRKVRFEPGPVSRYAAIQADQKA